MATLSGSLRLSPPFCLSPAKCKPSAPMIMESALSNSLSMTVILSLTLGASENNGKRSLGSFGLLAEKLEFPLDQVTRNFSGKSSATPKVEAW